MHYTISLLDTLGFIWLQGKCESGKGKSIEPINQNKKLESTIGTLLDQRQVRNMTTSAQLTRQTTHKSDIEKEQTYSNSIEDRFSRFQGY